MLDIEDNGLALCALGGDASAGLDHVRSTFPADAATYFGDPDTDGRRRILWNEFAKQWLAALLELGLTAKEVADEMGIRRTAVIGKARYMGVTHHRNVGPRSAKEDCAGYLMNEAPRQYTRQRPRTPYKTPAGAGFLATLGMAHAEVLRAMPERTDLAHLQEWQCRYILGDPKKEHSFCQGARAVALPNEVTARAGVSMYCEVHQKLASISRRSPGQRAR